MKNQPTPKSSHKKITTVIVIALVALIAGVVSVYFLKDRYNRDNLVGPDTISPDGSVEGIKVTFINSETREVIKKEPLKVEINNGVECITAPCPNSDICFVGETDSNGKAYLDLYKWFNDVSSCPIEVKDDTLNLGNKQAADVIRKRELGKISLEDWDCDGIVTTKESTSHTYFDKNTKEITVECSKS
jgi:hypothetical protein